MILFISLCALTLSLAGCEQLQTTSTTVGPGTVSSTFSKITSSRAPAYLLWALWNKGLGRMDQPDRIQPQGTNFRFDYTYHRGAEGWFKLHRIPTTWKDAYLNCHYEGAVLASPVNETMRLALKDVIGGQKSGESLQSIGVFTGVHATFGKGAYFSVEGIPLSRMPVAWAPGEPDNAENSEDCLLMTPSGTLADVNCTHVYPYVCYRRKQKNMPVMKACGTVDNGYTYDNRTGSCYKFHSDPLNWSRAFTACAHEGGHLAVINSKLELQLIQELYNKSFSSLVAGRYNRNLIFLGFRNFENNFLWMTIHGQTLKEAGYDGWQDGQPDSNGGGQHCGALFKDGFLDDSNCRDVFPFICEKQPSSLLEDEEL